MGLAAGALTALTACAEGDPNAGHIYVTDMLGDGCTYDAEEGGVVFQVSLAGHKDADLIAEVYRPAPGADEDHPGPVIASAVHEVREGAYDSPVTIVVPIEESNYDDELMRCILQTENHGADVLSEDGYTATP